MIKKLLALAACLALAATLVACDNSGGRAGKTNPDEWAGMEIRVAGYRSFSDDPLNIEYSLGAQEFNDKYGTTVKFQVSGGEGLGSKGDLAAAIMAGDPWEVQYCFGISTFPLTFVNNLYTPITDYLDFDKNGNPSIKGDKDGIELSKVTVDGTYWKGEYYGVSSLGMQEFWYMAYNETLMKELGVKTPYEYYKEDKWTMDAYKEVNAATTAAGYHSYSRVDRPHTGGMYMSEWDLDEGRVTVVYDQPKNVTWLNYWAELLTDPRYDVLTNGKVSNRSIIVRDDVFPNLIRDELTQETTDTIRYIYMPTLKSDEEGTPSTYLTDNHFLFPNGVQLGDKLPCAIELAGWMTRAKADGVMNGMYKDNMTQEDYEIMVQALDNSYFLPRLFYSGVFAIGSAYIGDMRGGKAVATHVAEQLESLKVKADEFNLKYAGK